MNTKLKPCPFCGGEAELIDGRKSCVVTSNAYARPWTVGCTNTHKCSILMPSTRSYSTAAEAVEAWNTRAERTCNLRYKLLSRKEQVEAVYCECGQELDRLHTWEPLHLPNYCQNCGVKVKE